MMALVGRLLRSPSAVARQCLEGHGQRELVTTSLLSVALGAAVFGAVVGSFRGDLQVLYSGLKVPLALLATLIVCVPGFHVVALALGQPRTLRATISLALASAGRGALVLLALSPLLWLAIDGGASYHGSVLLASACYGLGGLAALGVLLRGLGQGGRRLLSAMASVALFLAVSGQTGWILRPYLGRPSQQEVPFLRAREGGFADAVWTSGRSVRGVYDEPPRSYEPAPPVEQQRYEPGGRIDPFQPQDFADPWSAP